MFKFFLTFLCVIHITFLNSNPDLKKMIPFTIEEHQNLYIEWKNKEKSLERYYVILCLEQGRFPGEECTARKRLQDAGYSKTVIKRILENCHNIILKSNEIFALYTLRRGLGLLS